MVICVGIYKYCGTNDYNDKKMCCQQKPCRLLKVEGQRPYLNFVHRLQKSLLYPAHIFVLHGGISKLHGKTFVVRKDHVASFKVKIII